MRRKSRRSQRKENEEFVANISTKTMAEISSLKRKQIIKKNIRKEKGRW